MTLYTPSPYCQGRDGREIPPSMGVATAEEAPRLFFMHLWANDDAVTLARGLRAALDQMGTTTAR
jgi:hypothetical protein